MQNPLITIATQAARSVSKTIVNFMDRIHSIAIKGKNLNDFISEINRFSENEIISHIQKAYPEHSISTAESGFIEGNEYCWVIDPLDGSSNYIHGIPHFSTSISVKKKDQLEAGIVYDPIKQELFSAVRGQGAFLDNRRIRVSQCKKIDCALIATGPLCKKKQKIKPYLNNFENIFEKAFGMRLSGTTTLDLAYVASGRLDGFWEASIKEWDIAAGILLIQEAGGLISDFQGTNNSPFASNVVAGTPKIYRELTSMIGNSFKE